VLSHRTIVKTVHHRSDVVEMAQVAADLAEVAEVAAGEVR
jgi:hypothetical protein